MGFSILLLLCNLLIPLMMWGLGELFLRRPPKHVNSIYGYRSTRSMKNQQTWDFAQTCCGRVWKKIGLWLLIASAVVMLAVSGQSEDVMNWTSFALCMAQCVVLLLAIWPVERALKEHFDKDGKRRL